ncbi:MAG TPA: hypothetical protein VL400_09855 [Polyangiaceae bacterium]|nr:hypothetical protein [Polyangiaceae bacterium]
MRRSLWLVILALAACLDPTQATVVLSTNAVCGAPDHPAGSLNETGILAGNAARVKAGDLNTSTQACDGGDIGTIVLYPESGAREASLVAVGALDTASAQTCLEIAQGRAQGSLASCIIARRQVQFVDGSDLRVPVLLDSRCAGVLCSEGTTCVRDVDDAGNVVTKCVDSTVSCEDDGSCTNPGTGGAASTSSQGGAGGTAQVTSTDTTTTDTTTTTSTGGGGSGGGLPTIDATEHSTTGLSAVHVVSGDGTGWYASGVSTPNALVLHQGSSSTTFVGQTSVVALRASPVLTVVFGDGSVVFGADSYSVVAAGPTFDDGVVANSILYAVDGSSESLYKVQGGSASVAMSSASLGNSFAAIDHGNSFVMVGDRVCGWNGTDPAFHCATPVSGAKQRDVWVSGAFGYSVGGAAVEQVTFDPSHDVFLSETTLPLAPSLGTVALSSVDGNFAAGESWFGGKIGASGYLARVTTAGVWDEFVGTNLAGIEDVWVDNGGTVWFASGGKLYSFNPP